MSEEQVSFFGSNGTRLAGVLCRPEDRAGAAGAAQPAAVVLCQGLSGVKHLVLPGVAQHLARRGIASLRFDYAGYGESDGARGWIDPRARVDDALCAFTWLAAQPGIGAGIGVYGHSYGGPVAIGMAAREARVMAVVAVSSPGDGRSMLRSVRTSWDWIAFQHALKAERANLAAAGTPTIVDVQAIFPFSPTFLAQYEKLKSDQAGSSAMAVPVDARASADADAGGFPDQSLGTSHFYLGTVDAMLDFHPEDAARRLGPRPLLLVHGADDDVAPVEDVEAVYANAPGPKRWEIIPDAGHNDLDAGPGLDRAIELTGDWFVEHLGVT
jgi:alpha-beta hydrolase superfamily lysophospholipase